MSDECPRCGKDIEDCKCNTPTPPTLEALQRRIEKLEAWHKDERKPVIPRNEIRHLVLSYGGPICGAIEGWFVPDIKEVTCPECKAKYRDDRYKKIIELFQELAGVGF